MLSQEWLDNHDDEDSDYECVEYGADSSNASDNEEEVVVAVVVGDDGASKEDHHQGHKLDETENLNDHQRDNLDKSDDLDDDKVSVNERKAGEEKTVDGSDNADDKDYEKRRKWGQLG